MKELKPTLKNAVISKCHECMGYYEDGKTDCKNIRCPLYSWMPYKKQNPNLEWTEFHPKRPGLIKLKDIEISEALRERGRKLAKRHEKVLDNDSKNS